jgi:hypothetical protein
MNAYSIEKLMAETRRVAADYRRATGKALPVSGEIAIYDAIQLLGLEAAEQNAAGYDAIRHLGDTRIRIQVKARVMFAEHRTDQRIGQLKLEQDWDSVVLVLMNENYEPEEIYEAARDEILPVLDESKNSARSKRGAMSVARFKNIGRRVWPD